MDRRIIVVSNREPYAVSESAEGVQFQRTTGGLVSALEPIIRQSQGVWIAWDPDGEGRTIEVPDEAPRFTQHQVGVSRDEQKAYYGGFANSTLWPLFHYSLDKCLFEQRHWEHYQRVNARFAEAICKKLRPDDLVWIQDYHFLLLPSMVRTCMPEASIGFFLHIPFPPLDMFRVAPWQRELIRGLLGADLIGFHTPGYMENFLGSCTVLEDEVAIDVDRNCVTIDDREVAVGAFPIGIDVAEFESLARDPAVAERARRLRASIGVDRLILGVDRLDYSKGILERVEAIENYFERYPERCGKDLFLQIAVPSRTGVGQYQELRRQIDEAVGNVNSRFSTPAWSPIRYLARGHPRDQIVVLYCAADIALVTPLRDGMNLVAKEFCASRVDEQGVLILSELTGAATQLASDALTVNPFDTRGLATTIRNAVDMPVAEQRRRMRKLREAVVDYDVHRWVEEFLGALQSANHDSQRGQQNCSRVR